MTDLVISDHTQAERIGECLAVRFQEIAETRMQDVPIINAVLQTQAVGFHTWQGYAFGVLITPWFMNLLLVPLPDNDQAENPQEAVRETLPVGEKRHHVFPSGSYEFIGGDEPPIGPYEMCSLFSPMFEFEDQAAAVATAEAVLDAIFEGENRDNLSMHDEEITAVWQGEKTAQDVIVEQKMHSPSFSEIHAQKKTEEAQRIAETNPEAYAESTSGSDHQVTQKPASISRRDLLRGQFRGQG